MADPTFLEENADDVLALVLTHSHEDHYGAVLDLWPSFEKPVYCTAFTAAMLAAKRASDDIVDNVAVTLDAGAASPSRSAPSPSRPINVAHSIPESNALLITTPIGRVVHTGDWKLDPHPAVGPPTDVERFAGDRRRRAAPLALICDSTNALKDGESPSEDEVAATLAALIADAPHRVALTTFASNVGRVISIARAAREGRAAGGHVGPGLHRIFGIARELGMLEGMPPFLDQDAFKTLPRNKIVPALHRQPGRAACRHRAHRPRGASGDRPQCRRPGDLFVLGHSRATSAKSSTSRTC